MDKEKVLRKRKEAVYGVVKKLMYERAARFNKKHGNYLVQYAPHNQVLVMDTWNGAISQGHCTETLINGQFGPEGRIEYHTHLSPPEYSNDEYYLDDAVSMYKTLLAVI